MVCGAGRVGIGQDGREHGFQISQRADFFEVEVGLETTLKRPIINTRDEPHADPEQYRRLHVIIGDANLAEISTYLKVGTTALVLAMIEDRFITADLTVEGSVSALRAVSHDPTLKQLITLLDGRRLTAVQLQMEYLDLARKYVEDRYGADADDQTVDVLARWESVLDRLERDPMLCAEELDWVAKLKLLEQYRHRDGLDWDDAKLHLIDLQYADIRPEKGLYHRLVAAGRIERLLDDREVEDAMHDPPEDTRAYFRGRCLEKYADYVAAASWDSVIFDLPGRESLQRVPTIDPLRGSKAHVGALLDRCDTAEELFPALTRAERPLLAVWSRTATKPPSDLRFGTKPHTPDRRRGEHAARRHRQVDRVGDMAQEQKQPRKSTDAQEVTEEVAETDVAERKEALDDDVDAILDEIDDVLEANAEDFVKSFIQKGGE